MKKNIRFATIILSAIIAVAGAMEFCTTQSYAATHKHSMKYHKAVNATCTKAGNTAYYYCKGCKKYFKDKKGTTEIAKNSWVIAKRGHNMTKHAAKAATCTAKGNSAYYYCSRCKKYFSNASGTKTIKKNSWVKKALGHKLTYLKSEAKPTCTTKGHMAKCYQCTRCKKFFKDKKAKKSYSGIAALGHNRIYHGAVEETCQHTGNTAYYECTRCGKYFSDSDCTIQIKANSWVKSKVDHSYVDGKCKWCGQADPDNEKQFNTHKLTYHEKHDSTCNEIGNIAYYSCSECGKFFSDSACTTEIKQNSWVISAKTHVYNDSGVCILCGEKKSEGGWTPVA